MKCSVTCGILHERKPEVPKQPGACNSGCCGKDSGVSGGSLEKKGSEVDLLKEAPKATPSCCSATGKGEGVSIGCTANQSPAPPVATKQDSCCVPKAETCCPPKKTGCSPPEKGTCCPPKAGGCCPPKEKSYCSPKQNSCATTKETGCCSPKKEPEVVEKKQDCCAPKKDSCCPPKEGSCCPPKKSSCCPPKKEVRSTLGGSGCYAKPPVPENQKDSCCSPSKPTGTVFNTESSTSLAEACATHLQEAFSQYLTYLEEGRCICRNVLSGLSTCGRTQQPQAKPEKLSRVKVSASCGLDDIEITPVSPIGGKPKAPSVRLKEVDPENSASRQHVLLNVSGMTCTGCTRKLTNVLNNVDGISAIQVTFVTGVAEFDLDSAITNLQQVIPRIEKETGFKFSQIVSNYQTLDLLIDPAVAAGVCKQLDGIVESIEKVNKSTYRISYDPVVIGARSLFSSIEGITLAPPGNDAELANGRRRLLRMSWCTAAAAVLTIPILVLNWSNDPIPYSKRSIVSLVLATLVQGLAVPEFYAGALKSLIYSRVLEMDMLVVISITAAYVYSVVAFGLTHAGYVLETGEFFETSSLLITLVLLGRLIAAIAKVRAVSAVSVRSLQAEKAILVTTSGNTTEIDARLLQLGDCFVIPAHSRVVTDGVVINGRGSIDESMITGESVPVPKALGDEVIAGTINGASPLTVRMTRLPGKNSITDIANLVENALAAKPRIQDLADTVASYFIPVVISIALVVFGIWMAVAVKVRGEAGGSAFGIAITYAIAVLAVSCPCALGLAVPMVLVIAGGTAARSGVIIKRADAIERGHKVTDVVFDKTGTITKGDLAVVCEQLLSDCATEIQAVIRSMTKDNQHPVSIAVSAYLQLKSDELACVDNLESIPGSGIQGEWRGSIVKAGNPHWLNIENDPEISRLIEQGMTLFCITLDSTPVAAFGLKANIREEANKVISELQNSKIECHIVSGDSSRVVEDVAMAVGIPFQNVASRNSPAQKQQYVKDLMSNGRIVLFCGDGTNDAVAVAQSNVGVLIGTASDVTKGTADVVLLGGLDGILTLLDISKRSARRILFNFVWSAVYNVFAILLAAGAFVKARIPPAYAGLGEIVSVVPVIVVAMTLSRARRTA
ncbi:hypothetical protein TWF730_003377 [Orbilia blumenaviensis]|uniref:HMA domain-containing protein n=1 Tax=Orbilia blumenaviensis TaxID=1796055 RepID=A0AAV9U7U4_9PEZI